MVRFVHTSDLQIGMPFHRVEGDRGARLRALRLSVLERIGSVVSERGAEFVVIAGDFFDANTVDNETVVQACERVRRMTVPVYVLPGNHDYCSGPSSVYHRRTFLDHRPQNLIVLEEREPLLVAGGKAVLLPAPLLHRHAKGDTTRHLTADWGRELAPDAIRIGVAHGGVVAFDLDWDEHPTNYIDPGRATFADLDYLALGDWHGRKRVNARTWYSGAPEPTNFKSNDPGYVLVVEVAAHGADPVVTSAPVASSRWIAHAERIESGADVDRLDAWFSSLERPEDVVLALDLEGTLSLEGMERLDRCLDRVRYLVLDLRIKNRVVPRASDEELDDIAQAGYIQVAVERLRAMVEAGDADANTAALALQILYRLHVTSGS